MKLDVARYAEVARHAARPQLEGRLEDAVGLVLEARGIRPAIGDVCDVAPLVGEPIPAEVVGLRGDRVLLMPLGETHGLSRGARVRSRRSSTYFAVGEQLLGRVVDAMGKPMDALPPPALDAHWPKRGEVVSPLMRRAIDTPLTTGVRAIDGTLTLAKGQRIGIFAGGGVGKSTLLGMMVKNAKVDVCVVGLIGERGREVEEFVRLTLGKEGLTRSVVVAATSSDPPLLRARGALYAVAIAEHFRSLGLDVLLVMDSVTRYAMALREIGVATGEPPTTKGYTPSVFAALPHLLERAGTCEGDGSITGLYTILVEGDDLSDPIADAARAILDGHIVLARSLAEKGHFPAIDVPASISRCMAHVATKQRMTLASRTRELLATHREAEDLLAIGAYKPGSSPKLDEALRRMPRLEAFLRQATDAPEKGDVDAKLAAVFADEGRA